MDISIIILTWNSEKYIKICIDSIIGDLEADSYSYEIFIIDNGSKDKTLSYIRKLKIQYGNVIKPLFLDRNYGTTYPRNLGLKKAKGKFIVIMDSDIEFSRIGGTIGYLADILDQDERIGLAAPGLFYTHGGLQKSTDDFPTVFTKTLRYFFLKIIEKKQKFLPKIKYFRETDYAISALWILKRKILEEVGLLDENIFYAPEDVDYCLRVWKAGYKVVYVPDVSCIHHAQEISRGMKINKAAYQHILGLIYYFRKHRYLFKKPKGAGACSEDRRIDQL